MKTYDQLRQLYEIAVKAACRVATLDPGTSSYKRAERVAEREEQAFLKALRQSVQK